MRCVARRIAPPTAAVAADLPAPVSRSRSCSNSGDARSTLTPCESREFWLASCLRATMLARVRANFSFRVLPST
jgi:hypothetical protein